MVPRPACGTPWGPRSLDLPGSPPPKGLPKFPSHHSPDCVPHKPEGEPWSPFLPSGCGRSDPALSGGRVCESWAGRWPSRKPVLCLFRPKSGRVSILALASLSQLSEVLPLPSLGASERIAHPRKGRAMGTVGGSVEVAGEPPSPPSFLPVLSAMIRGEQPMAPSSRCGTTRKQRWRPC